MYKYLPQPVLDTFEKLPVKKTVSTVMGGIMLVSPKLHHRLNQFLLLGPYRGDVVETIQENLYRLEDGEIDQVEFLDIVRDAVREVAVNGEFDEWIEQGAQDTDAITLAGSTLHAPGKEWFLRIFMIEEGEQDYPHQHNSLSSFQVIQSGELRLREYARGERIDDDLIELDKVTDGVLEPGDTFETTEMEPNAHWFEGESDVVSVNFNMRGYWDENDRYLDADETGRHYLLPVQAVPDDKLYGKETSKDVVESVLSD